jgi:hypothetical protein
MALHHEEGEPVFENVLGDPALPLFQIDKVLGLAIDGKTGKEGKIGKTGFQHGH